MYADKWAVWVGRAENLTSDQLRDRITVLVAAAYDADALDRVNGTDRGGEIRDEISVLRQELRSRKEPWPEELTAGWHVRKAEELIAAAEMQVEEALRLLQAGTGNRAEASGLFSKIRGVLRQAVAYGER